MSTAELVRDIIVEETHWEGPRDALTDDYQLVEQQLLDSLALMRLVTRLEEAFSITVRDEDVLPSNFASIARIAAFVDAQRGA